MFTNPGRSLMHNIYPLTLGQRLGAPDGHGESTLLKVLEHMKKEEESKQPKPAKNMLPVGQLNVALTAGMESAETTDNIHTTANRKSETKQNDRNESVLDILAELQD